MKDTNRGPAEGPVPCSAGGVASADSIGYGYLSDSSTAALPLKGLPGRTTC